jgi:hypothetical protein
MEDNSALGAADGTGISEHRKSFLLAKLLLNKYNTIHQFHMDQLTKYPIACCETSISGSASLYANNRIVDFDIKSSKDYYLKDGKIKPRLKYSPIKLIYMIKEQKEKDMAIRNLKLWTRELLWADTSISITFNGKLIYGVVNKEEEKT